MIPERPSAATFVVDSMLGKVAKWLRILGYDTLYVRLTSASQIDRWIADGRIIVTRHRKWAPGERVILLSADRLEAQMQQLIARLDLKFDRARLLTRCPRCNQSLQPIAKKEAESRVPDAVLAMGHQFHHCPDCGRMYWPGTHPDRMLKRLKRFWGNQPQATD
jgi:uncharacterized protein with PIN domain